MNPIPCSVCGEDGHHIRRCPSLASPLKDGFYAPPAGARQGGGDDDETCKIETPVYPVFSITLTRCLKHKPSSKSVKSSPMKL